LALGVVADASLIDGAVYFGIARGLPICRADGKDLCRTMVQLGMAWAFVRYSRDYVDVETQGEG
jgi:hypothetical protein